LITLIIIRSVMKKVTFCSTGRYQIELSITTISTVCERNWLFYSSFLRTRDSYYYVHIQSISWWYWVLFGISQWNRKSPSSLQIWSPFVIILFCSFCIQRKYIWVENLIFKPIQVSLPLESPNLDLNSRVHVPSGFSHQIGTLNNEYILKITSVTNTVHWADDAL
jgi:hypothetical protein